MNLQEYKNQCKRTCPNLGDEFKNQLHMAIGASTETGELLDAYKKSLAYNKPLDIVNISEEIGDIFWYLINLCTMLNLNAEDILEKNINKLETRYPDKFDSDHAINRNLDKEREILER
jgi:NTP pyrophosphatase (non-canonical NTP hydrolase)